MNNNNALEIIQLNCKSLNTKLGEAKLLIYANKPDIVALSETWMTNDKYKHRFINYTTEWKDRGALGGGLGLLIRWGIQYQRVDLTLYNDGNLEIQAIKILIKDRSDLIILHVYNPSKSVAVNEFKHYIEQLGRKFIIIGDINAHSRLLDTRCVKSNVTGKSLEHILTDCNLCLITPQDFYTFISFSTEKRSCLDLCLASPNLAADTDIDFVGDVGSDHAAIRTRVRIQPQYNEVRYPKCWKIDKSKLSVFSGGIESSKIMKPNNMDAIVEDFTGRILKAAGGVFTKSSGKSVRKGQNRWWTQDCDEAVRERRRARRLLEKHPMQKNVHQYQEASHKAKLVCQEAKKKSFHDFIESLDHKTPTGEVWKKIKSLKVYKYVPAHPMVIKGNIVTDPNVKAIAYVGAFDKYLRE